MRLGYDAKYLQKLIVKAEDLTKSSHTLVEVQCDICGSKKFIRYTDYLNNIKYDGNYYCRINKCYIKKVYKSNMEKYGCENIFESEETKNKTKNFYISNYGVEYNTQVEHIRNSRFI